MKDNNHNISGIYKIRCKSNNKIYIGSSFNIPRRWAFHKSQLNRNVHPNIMLQRSWNLYGENAFVWKVIELCPIGKLLIFEKKWFKKTKCCNRKYGFNIAIDSSSPMKGHKHSVKTKIKMSKTHKGKIISKNQKRKISESLLKYFLINKISIKTRQKMSEVQMGHKVTKETRLKIGKGNRGSKHYLSKLTEKDIPKIKELIKNGLSDTKIGKIFSVDKSTIRAIRLNKTWKHIS